MKEKKIVVFGDSVAKGLKLEGGKPFKLKTNAVEIISKHFNIEIENNSCFGQTITRLKEKGVITDYIAGLDKKKQNIVVFCIGGNDSDFEWKEVDKSPIKKHLCKTPLNEFESVYSELITLLKKKKVEVFLCGLPPVRPESFFENCICKIAKKENILQFFEGDISNISRYQEMYNNALNNLANEHKIGFLDIRAPFLTVRNLGELYAEDGLHPNEKGHKLIAKKIIKYFETVQKL